MVAVEKKAKHHYYKSGKQISLSSSHCFYFGRQYRNKLRLYGYLVFPETWFVIKEIEWLQKQNEIISLNSTNRVLSVTTRSWLIILHFKDRTTYSDSVRQRQPEAFWIIERPVPLFETHKRNNAFFLMCRYSLTITLDTNLSYRKAEDC